MTGSAAAAAHTLADQLHALAGSLDSDDLETISDAMVQIRSAARDLATALESRGWGGGVLYGFGEPGKAELLARAADEIAEMIEAGELDPDCDQEPDTADDALPQGRRVSVQSRVDYVISDEVTFRQYVRSRLASRVDRGTFAEDLIMTSPVLVLCTIDGIEGNDYSAHGLASAGYQCIVRPVDKALTELDPDDASDIYPTFQP